MAEIADKQDVLRLESKVDELLSRLSDGYSSGGKIMWDLRETKKRTGFSESQLMKMVREKKLESFKTVDEPNAKIYFYPKQVIELVPEHLRRQYGEPI